MIVILTQGIIATVDQLSVNFRNHSFWKIIFCFQIVSLAFSDETMLSVEVVVFEEDSVVCSISPWDILRV